MMQSFSLICAVKPKKTKYNSMECGLVRKFSDKAGYRLVRLCQGRKMAKVRPGQIWSNCGGKTGCFAVQIGILINTYLYRKPIEQRNVTWCPGPDSNRHTLRRGILSPLRLPISPPGQEARSVPKVGVLVNALVKVFIRWRFLAPVPGRKAPSCWPRSVGR